MKTVKSLAFVAAVFFLSACSAAPSTSFSDAVKGKKAPLTLPAPHGAATLTFSTDGKTITLTKNDDGSILLNFIFKSAEGAAKAVYTAETGSFIFELSGNGGKVFPEGAPNEVETFTFK